MESCCCKPFWGSARCSSDVPSSGLSLESKLVGGLDYVGLRGTYTERGARLSARSDGRNQRSESAMVLHAHGFTSAAARSAARLSAARSTSTKGPCVTAATVISSQCSPLPLSSKVYIRTVAGDCCHKLASSALSSIGSSCARVARTISGM